MLPPYGTDEIAAAVLARLRARRLPVASVAVTGDDTSRTWLVTARFQDSRTISVRYPYSQREGILTPREIAESFVQRAASD